MTRLKTVKQMVLEIAVGDVVNGKHVINKVKSSMVLTEDGGKFRLGTSKDNGDKINTVARNGFVYYKRMAPGGYRHGKREEKS